MLKFRLIIGGNGLALGAVADFGAGYCQTTMKFEASPSH